MTYISSEMTQTDRQARLVNVIRFATEDALEEGAITDETYQAIMDALSV